LVTRGLEGLSEKIGSLMKEFQPGVLVIDSFKAIGAFAADEAEYRRFLHDLAGRLTTTVTNTFRIGEYQRHESNGAEFAVADAIIAMDTNRVAERYAWPHDHRRRHRCRRPHRTRLVPCVQNCRPRHGSVVLQDLGNAPPRRLRSSLS